MQECFQTGLKITNNKGIITSNKIHSRLPNTSQDSCCCLFLCLRRRDEVAELLQDCFEINYLRDCSIHIYIYQWFVTLMMQEMHMIFHCTVYIAYVVLCSTAKNLGAVEQNRLSFRSFITLWRILFASTSVSGRTHATLFDLLLFSC